MEKRPSLLAICNHEAGHAIVQLATGPAPWIDHIEVNREGVDRLGMVHSRAMLLPYMREVNAPAEILEQWRRLAARDVVNALAGPIAEARSERRSRLAIQLAASKMAIKCMNDDGPDRQTDAARVRDRLEWLMPGEEKSGFEQAWIATEEIVAAWWREIVQLGRHLAAHRRIGGEELLAIWKEMRDRRGVGATTQAAAFADWLSNPQGPQQLAA